MSFECIQRRTTSINIFGVGHLYFGYWLVTFFFQLLKNCIADFFLTCRANSLVFKFVRWLLFVERQYQTVLVVHQ
jgi:lipopolysaccharide export LptBFGC system permease protein LptF